jgi:CRP-like cAMP-binding protein/CheY-like chemotaxis protein
MNEKILVIEDNNDIRESTAEILEFSGYKVIQASNGKQGVELALQKPDLILCDIMMPELDGYGVLYMLGKNVETGSIPFIFLTAKSERIDFRKGMEMGADDYLTKPFDEIELLKAIEGRFAKEQKQKAHHSKTLLRLESLRTKSESGAAELKTLIAGRKIRQIKKGQVIYYDGDQPLGIYLILEGSIKTARRSDDGRELMTGLFKADDYLGVSALLLEQAFTETAEALEESAICLLHKDPVIALLNRYPDIGSQFIKILSNDIRDKEEQLLDLAYHSVRKRLSNILVKLSTQGKELDFKISREELASMVGIASETVSRTLTDFKEEGLIDKKGSIVFIKDLERLQKTKN